MRWLPPKTPREITDNRLEATHKKVTEFVPPGSNSVHARLERDKGSSAIMRVKFDEVQNIQALICKLQYDLV